ncbi:hypothetical protein Taro_054996, partial [Colocasia esculenta]|nr:hypothetical protein [Colocasia esculenta]
DVIARAKCSWSSSLLVLVEVRFPQNYVVIVSGCCGVALWVESGFLSLWNYFLRFALKTVPGLFLAIVVLPQG